MAEEIKEQVKEQVKEQKKLSELEVLKARNAELEAEVAALNNRPPTKSELKAAREKKEADRKAIAEKQDKEAKDLVTIQKHNKAGDLVRERVCARVDVPAYEKQGYKLVK